MTKAASAYEGMQQIGSNLHLGTSGQPNTYRSSLPSGKHSWASEAKDAGHYRDSGTKTQRITTSTGSSLNFEYSYEGSVQMYGVVGGFKAGGGYHWGASVGTEKVIPTALPRKVRLPAAIRAITLTGASAHGRYRSTAMKYRYWAMLSAM